MDFEDTDPTVDEEETDELTTAAQVVQKLEEVWVNENLAPELLQYEEELVECMIDQIQHMESSLQKIKKEDFRIVFHKMELDRIKYVLKSYLRTRLEKIEKYGAHLLHLETQEQSYTDHMSNEEQIFAQTYVTNVKKYLHDVALTHMPSNMQTMKFEEMCSKPQMNKSVFIRVKKECLGVLNEDQGDEEILDLRKESQHILRYRTISHLLKEGSVQLI